MKGGAIIIGLGALAMMLSLWAQDIVVPVAPTNTPATNAAITNGITGNTTNTPPVKMRPMKIGDIDYRTIVEKNPFRLIIPKPETPTVEKPIEIVALAPVRLTGITTINGESKALLLAGGRGANKRYLLLGEGKGEDVGKNSRVVVKSIDAKEGKVVIINKGTDFELSLKDEDIVEPIAAPGLNPPAPEPSTAVSPPDPPEPVKPSVKLPVATTKVPRVKRRGFGLFDPNIQAATIEANQIPALREMPRGQLSLLPPTDLPEGRR